MGIGNFIKRQAGIGRLPTSQINEITIVNWIKTTGVPFIVALPIYDTIRIGGSYSISESMGGGFRQSLYTPAPTQKRQRKIKTNISYTLTQITIHHAQKNGKHIIIKTNKIATAVKLKNGIMIELVDGLQYQFLMDNDIKNAWKTCGFNPQFAIDVIYNLISGTYIREAQIKYGTNDINQIMEIITKNQNNVQKPYEIPNIENKENIKKEIEKERKELIKEEKCIEKEKEKIEKNIQKTRLQTINEFSIKLKKLKETYDIDAITQEEYELLKSEFINEIKSIPIPQNINPMTKLKECKELLDLEILTQEEYNEIKLIFINNI